jgi:hypothetical protein
MFTQADLSWNNTVSRNEQRKNRSRRNKSKELRAAFKETLGSLDNTKDKRELREQFESSLKDIDTGLESNRSGSGSTIQDDSIDNVDSSADGGGGGGGGLPDGYDETTVTLCQNGSPVDGSILFKLA